MPEELFGVRWARRLRIAIPVSAAAALVAGSVAFVVWSQTLGRAVVAIGLGLGLTWFLLRRGDPEGALGALRRVRPQLIALGGVLFAVGLVVFSAAEQDLGLLLVLLGGAALAVNLVDVQQKPMPSPMDGPMYGDTPPYGD